jgi:uncharacterized cupin superfamily protein
VKAHSSHASHRCWARTTGGDLPIESAGPPPTWDLALGEVLDHQVGVWQVGPGTIRDVEADELFVVVRGRAHIQLDDATVLDVAPGTVCFLAKGTRTTWQVHETLRKVYVQFNQPPRECT